MGRQGDAATRCTRVCVCVVLAVAWLDEARSAERLGARMDGWNGVEDWDWDGWRMGARWMGTGQAALGRALGARARALSMDVAWMHAVRA